MEKQLLIDTPIEHRVGILQDSCYQVLAGQTYTRRLSIEEVTERKTSLFEAVAKVQSLKNELKQIKTDYSKKLKDLAGKQEVLIQEIQFEAETAFGNLYAMDDQKSGMMGMYDETGTLVSVRPLAPNERQTSFLTIKTGSND